MSSFWNVWPVVASTLSILGLIFGVLQGIPMISGAINRYRQRLHVRQIIDPNDADLIALREIQALEFGDPTDGTPAVGDDSPELLQWLEDSRRNMSVPGYSRPKHIVLVLKENDNVCGYLTAQYFADRRTVFLWYVAVPSTLFSSQRVRREGTLLLLGTMLKVADKIGPKWQHILTEVESDGAKDLRARAKLNLFQHCAAKLSQMVGREPVSVFRLDVEFRLPVIKPEHAAAGAADLGAAWLLYAQRHDEGAIMRKNGRSFLARAEVEPLLETLLVHSYAQAFHQDDVYTAYAKDLYNRYRSALPELVELQKNWRSIGKAPVATLAPHDSA